METEISKTLYWTPRVLSIIFIAFLSLFSLDVFSMGLDAKGILVGLFMHNIPTLILLALLIIAWRYEIVGAIVFGLVGALYIGMIFWNIIKGTGGWYMLGWTIEIAGPAFLIAYFFYLGRKRKNTRTV